MKLCKYCDKPIEGSNSIYANHVRWCTKNEKNGDKGSSNISKKAFERYLKINGLKKEFNVNCYRCKKDFIVIESENKFPKKEKYFCSISCANSGRKRIKYTHSDEFIEKTRERMKKLWQDPTYVKNHMIANKVFSSKGERELINYFKNNFIEDNWTFGGAIKFNNTTITRDLYSNKLKVCIEYDGIWHFKDIHGQLEEKQYKDKCLEEWVIENNWKLVRIKDELYRKNKEFWINKLIESIYNSNEQIIKLY